MVTCDVKATTIQANQQNGKKGIGPTSEDGKKKSRMNAVRHGLTARTAVLRGEDEEAYEEQRAKMYEEHQPVGVMECFCVDEMVLCMWNLRRSARMRIEIFEALRDQLREDAARAAMKEDSEEVVDDIQKYLDGVMSLLQAAENPVRDEETKEEGDERAKKGVHESQMGLLADVELRGHRLKALEALRSQAHVKTTLTALDGPSLGEVFLADAANGDGLGKLLRYDTFWLNRLSKNYRMLQDLQSKRLFVTEG